MCKPYNVTKRWLHTYRHSDRIDSDWMYANAKWIAILWLQLFQFVSCFFFLICRFASLFINNIHTWKPPKLLPCFISKCQLHGNTCVKIIKKLVKQEKQHPSIVLNSNRIHFFGFAVVITPQFANMLIFCEPTQSEQDFSAKMNISAIFDSAISVCKAFFSNT